MQEKCFECPFMAADRNRFPEKNFFIGEIENGIRYLFGHYDKKEIDEMLKKIVDDVAEKANQADFDDFKAKINNDFDAVNIEIEAKADNIRLEALEIRVDALEYEPVKINWFGIDKLVAERGDSVDITLSWSVNKFDVATMINGAIVSGNSKGFKNVTNSQTYTLDAYDGQTSDTANVSISFVNRIYYGAAADISDIKTLESVLSDNKSRTITVDASDNKYIIYAIPSRLGKVNFYVSGFEGGFEEPVQQSITNAFGYQENYYIYRSTRPNLGKTTVEIKG